MIDWDTLGIWYWESLNGAIVFVLGIAFLFVFAIIVVSIVRRIKQ